MQVEALSLRGLTGAAQEGGSISGPRLDRPPASLSRMPDRYKVSPERRSSILTCTEAPTIQVHLERGFTVTAAEARSYPQGSIFLDGAAQGEPFLSPERAVYNLDHHEGCVRAFTLATCEQAMVLIRKRVDLRKREWTIYANDADLDTVLAIWVLLNHLRLVHQNPELVAEILPLLRLEGTIDALGVELQDLCGLPPDLMRITRARMDQLLRYERSVRSSGAWEEVDLAAFVARQLRAIDRMVYPPEVLGGGHVAIDELARAEIGGGSIAVVCRSDLGVYEVEQELRRLHGDRLGIFALQKTPGTYTLRQVDPCLPTRLEEIYAHLNLLDPGSDGTLSSNRWGGSDEIGGSPRGAGSQMSPEQVALACRSAYRRAGWWARVSRLAGATVVSAFLMVVALLPVLAPGLFEVVWATLHVPPLSPGLTASALLLVLSGGLYALWGRRTPGLYGLRAPAGRDAWFALPFALAGAACGGLWLPLRPFEALATLSGTLVLVAMPLAVELAFRGLVHGMLAARFRIQHSGGRWFLSIPALATSALYALWAALPFGAPVLPALAQIDATAGHHPALPVAGAFLFGLAAAVARERSESVATPVLLHWTALAALLLATL